MLTRLFPFLDPAEISADLASQLRALADDCERLSFGEHVSSTVLDEAPLLVNWVPAATQAGLHLIGQAFGHPVHGNHRMVMTTPLWWADPEGKWARSQSRFYRLGSPADPEDIGRLLELAGIGASEDEA